MLAARPWDRVKLGGILPPSQNRSEHHSGLPEFKFEKSRLIMELLVNPDHKNEESATRATEAQEEPSTSFNSPIS